MALVVLLGGARSGKSRLAVDLADACGRPVTVIATAEAGDEEMRERIEAHRAERPAAWQTLEEPLELEQALAGIAPERSVVVDCLSLWVANLMARDGGRDEIVSTGARAAAAAAGRPGLTVAVSNEVGLGIVPVTPSGRAYRDLLGTVNRLWVDASVEAALVVAGRRLRLE